MKKSLTILLLALLVSISSCKTSKKFVSNDYKAEATVSDSVSYTDYSKTDISESEESDKEETVSTFQILTYTLNGEERAIQVPITTSKSSSSKKKLDVIKIDSTLLYAKYDSAAKVDDKNDLAIERESHDWISSITKGIVSFFSKNVIFLSLVIGSIIALVLLVKKKKKGNGASNS